MWVSRASRASARTEGPQKDRCSIGAETAVSACRSRDARAVEWAGTEVVLAELRRRRWLQVQGSGQLRV